MDIKKAYFELIKDRVSDAYEKQKDQIKAVSGSSAPISR